MLHYRLFVEVHDPRREIERKTREQLHAWLRRKGLDADALELGAEVRLAPHATGTLAESDRADGARSLRARIVEDNGEDGEWATQLTVDIPGSERSTPWIWLDLHGPSHTPGAIPHLARSLLEVVDASTGGVRHGEAQPVSSRDEVAELVEAVCDPSRRELVFIAGSDPRLEFSPWLDHVRRLLRDCVGLAGSYVLTPGATEMFNNALGPGHSVTPWTVRTFQPGVGPDDPHDARRHTTLGMERIVAESAPRLAALLGRRARDTALETPLPSAAARVDRIFHQQRNESLLAALDRPAQAQHRPADAPAASPATEDHPVWQALQAVLGDDEVTPDRVLELGELAEVARNARAGRDALSATLGSYESDLAELRAGSDELTSRLEDAQLEAAIAEESRAAQAAEVRRLQTLLITTGHADRIWGDDGAEHARCPQDCVEVADMIADWQFVRFTGSADHLRELDHYDPTGAWAGKVWDALGALDDYARAVTQGTFSGGVHHYLDQTPPGYRTTPLRHASDESATVRSNPQLARMRVFPVPTEVDPSGEAFFGPHFRIAQFATVSPRLYYLNDVRSSGHVYVGYIGKHLKNTHTN